MPSSSRHTLAVIAPSADPNDFPLGEAISQLRSHYRLRILALRSSGSDDPLGEALTLEELGLPAHSLRFALDDDELSSIAKPAFLLKLFEETEQAITFVDGNCLLNGPAPIFTEPISFDLEVLPVLPIELAAAKGGMAAALDAGLGDPTGSVLRIRPTEASRRLLADWRHWVEYVYATEPTRSLVEAELKLLRALPGAYRCVGWSREPVVAIWSDLHHAKETTRLIDTTGFSHYQQAPGLAYSLMERRTHSGRVVDQMAERMRSPWVDIPVIFQSGHRVTPLARRILRAVDPTGKRWADPAADNDTGSFRQWLLHEDSRRLPRFAQALYWARPDLQQSFPPRKTPVVDFVHWLETNSIGVDESPSSPSRAPGRATKAVRLAGKRLGFTSATLASAREFSRHPFGVNLVGFASAETGLGEALRSTIGAVRDSGSEVSVLDFSNRIYARQLGGHTRNAIGAPYDVTILHLNPTELVGYARDVLAYRLSADRLIGFFFWETEQIPVPWQSACDMVDEIWVASTYLMKAFARVTNKPIRILGMPVNVPTTTKPDRKRFGIPEADFVVSYVTDAYSGLERKDPLRALRAFERAFGPRYERVHLLLKISNLEKFPELRSRIQEEVSGKPVTIIAEYLDREELWNLLACSDAYLSLHASEGFGLTILEAMALGIPPIVTAYGGNMDFNGPDNSLLVGYRMTPATGGPANIYDGNGLWADPDVNEAARHLRALQADGALRAQLGERAQAVASRHSADGYQRQVAELLGLGASDS